MRKHMLKSGHALSSWSQLRLMGHTDEGAEELQLAEKRHERAIQIVTQYNVGEAAPGAKPNKNKSSSNEDKTDDIPIQLQYKNFGNGNSIWAQRLASRMARMCQLYYDLPVWERHEFHDKLFRYDDIQAAGALEIAYLCDPAVRAVGKKLQNLLDVEAASATMNGDVSVDGLKRADATYGYGDNFLSSLGLNAKAEQFEVHLKEVNDIHFGVGLQHLCGVALPHGKTAGSGRGPAGTGTTCETRRMMRRLSILVGEIARLSRQHFGKTVVEKDFHELLRDQRKKVDA